VFDSPLSASAYDVLGVAPDADEDALRRAYRRRLRETHPDTGGDAQAFVQVQRAWELVGVPDARAAYDRGHGFGGAAAPSFAPDAPTWRPPSRPADTRPRARSFGQPGGWRRERYLDLMREWVGRGVRLEDPYDPALVRTAPRELRRLLADALAEEATARIVGDLGMGYTVWHDVAVDPRDPDLKIDHVVLGPRSCRRTSGARSAPGAATSSATASMALPSRRSSAPLAPSVVPHACGSAGPSSSSPTTM